MPRNKQKIPLSPLARAFYNNNITRVSQKATQRLAKWVEEYARRLSQEAIRICRLSKRKTLHDKDFKTAIEIFERRKR